jgi:predicted enzyme related to lactoylglutathione lyase
MFQTGENEGGAVYERQQGEIGPIVYFSVKDIEAALDRVRELGGQSEDKAPVPGMGWYARCHDTEGNTFSLWQSDEKAPGPDQG